MRIEFILLIIFGIFHLIGTLCAIREVQADYSDYMSVPVGDFEFYGEPSIIRPCTVLHPLSLVWFGIVAIINRIIDLVDYIKESRY